MKSKFTKNKGRNRWFLNIHGEPSAKFNHECDVDELVRAGNMMPKLYAMLDEIVKMQSKNYGNGIATHVKLSSLSKKAKLLLAEARGRAIVISEKDKMIVDAVNHLKCRESHDSESTVWYREVHNYFAFGMVVTSDTVCTVNEYIQCIKEMSEAKWMQNPVEELMLSAREEAEIKAAKEKQLSYLKKEYKYMADVATLNALFFQMQKSGDLAEILLGLEK